MEAIFPNFWEIDEYTLLDDIGFDSFYKKLLVRDLEDEFKIIIPVNEVDCWQIFRDIVESVERYQH